jgi:uncharacterized membrane protein
MNQAHLHLLLNHLPVIGIILGLPLLAAALLRQNGELQRASLAFVLLVALLAVPAYLTGEPAEKVIEHLPGVSEALIKAHEEAAEIAFIAALLAGAAALGGLVYARVRQALPRWVVGAVFLLALASAGLMGWAANLGGQIRHPEIRTGYTPGAQPPDGGADGSAESESREK